MRKFTQTQYKKNLRDLVRVLKAEQKVHPHPENAAALQAIQAAVQDRRERELFNLLQEQERGEVLYFREIPQRLHP